jgi:hypothetical protein
MRICLFALPSLALLAGCAGYAIDYTKPKTSILGPELTRFGLDAGQAQCVGDRLATSLSVWQLRQLQLSAASLTTGYTDPNRLMVSDFIWVAKNVKDPKVGFEASGAAEACGLGAATVAAAELPPAPLPVPQAAEAAPGTLPPVSSAAPPPAAPAARTAAPTWVNLGAAPTGQSIAVDASSLSEDGSYRSGWFRLTNPGATARSASSYLLRVDCSARTINSMGVRKYGPNGAITEERDFGPGGEGAAAVESGTVMQIAYLALCT